MKTQLNKNMGRRNSEEKGNSEDAMSVGEVSHFDEKVNGGEVGVAGIFCRE